MKALILALATAGALIAVPAIAGSPTPADKPMTLAQADVNVEIGPGGLRIGPERRRYEERRHERRGWRETRENRGCREITIKERRGDQIIIKKIQRC